MYTISMKNNVQTKKPGRTFENPFLIDRLKKMKPGDTMIIDRADWPLKTRPGRYVLRRQTDREYDSRTLADDSGWLITAE